MTDPAAWAAVAQRSDLIRLGQVLRAGGGIPAAQLPALFSALRMRAHMLKNERFSARLAALIAEHCPDQASGRKTGDAPDVAAVGQRENR